MDQVHLPADTWALAGRLSIAVLLGALVGLDRELSQKPAGLRTHALVCLGAALATLAGLFLAAPPVSDSEAPGRIVQGLVAGVGFIGGGVILHLRHTRQVLGLTTAATTWVVAAIGVATGAGLWRSASIAVILTLGVLMVGGPIDRKLEELFPSSVDDD